MDVGPLEKGPDGLSKGQPKRKAETESDPNFARSDQRAKAFYNGRNKVTQAQS